MKKTFFLLTLLCLPLFAFSQVKRISIEWNSISETLPLSADANNSAQLTDKKTYQERRKDAIARLNLSFANGVFTYREQWEDTGYANENSLQLSNVQYTALSSEEQQKIDVTLVPETISYDIISTEGRGVIYTMVSVSPVVKRNGIFQKVTSFEISYSYRSSAPQNVRMPISNSVLATGAWYKFQIGETGIYRLSKSFLNDLGMNTSNLDPRRLKVYGHGGKPLPLLVSRNSEYDLPQNAIQVIGEEDGSFDNEDYVLFYGIGTLGFDRKTDENIDSHINPYSDEAYYYITADGDPGLRIQPMVEPSAAPTTTITSYDAYQFHELDEESPGKVGRKWFGNRFDIESSQSYSFAFQNLVGGSQMDVTVKAGAVSATSTSMAISINGTSVNPLMFSISDILSVKSYEGQIPAPNSGEVTVDLEYSNAGNPSSIAYLDYIRIRALSQLVGTGSQFNFRYNNAQTLSGVGAYELGNMTDYQAVWDVTNKGNIGFKPNEDGSSISFKTNLGEIRDYVAVHKTDFYTPIKIAQSQVANQNLKGTIFQDASGAFQDVDYIIIAPSFLIQPALRLAKHHKDLRGLRVKVVPTEKIYEEFSSGKQDVSAIRNFLKYVYDNGVTDKLKYVGLLGDTSVDYKDRIAGNDNIVPSWHTLESISTTTSFVSDDFFVCFDPTSGEMEASDRMDAAVGRILCDDVASANAMVDKIINYSTKRSYGNWRNNFLLVSDDVDELYEYASLEATLDEIGDDIGDNKGFINVKKIHTDAFQQEASAGGDRYPEVTKAMNSAIDVGALIITYFGHGGEDGLAKEYIFTKTDAQSLQNRDRLPLFVTVTCEYTRFDNPIRITAGELMYDNREGGAVSLITTTRSIRVTLGVTFNKVLAPILFGYGTSDYVTPAEALMLSKNELSSDVLKRVVFYIGDPAMELAFPKPSIRLTTLNGEPISLVSDTLKALSKVRMGGEVVDEVGNLLTNYNGTLEAKVYDKYVQRETLGNDGTKDDANDYDGDGDTNNVVKLNFKTLGEGLFNGKASVTNGLFEFDFVVPRDIQIPVGRGRVSLYSQKENEFEDQAGFNLAIKVGGLNENAAEDNQGPLISLFMNDESFASGGYTNDSPILIAKLEDENGLNTASGIGHDMIAILDGDEANPIVLNEYYQADVDDYMRGNMSYRLRDLEEGLHTLTFKAWDVYNNSSTAEIQFIVAGDNSLKITRVLNYPNPFVDYTEFWFNHNRPFEPLEIQVQVFTITGKVVWTRNDIDTTEGFLSRKITWDGRDDFGDRIGKGVYVYKITVKSTLTNKQVEKFEKLVIL